MGLKERDIKTISKTVSIQVSPANKEEARNAIAHQLRNIILCAAQFGLNRTYLLKYRRIIQLYYYLYCFTVNIIVIYFMTYNGDSNVSYNMLRDTGVTEYILLVLIAMVSKKSSLLNLFEDICTFDKALNIQHDLDITLPIAREWYWLIFSFAYSLFEYVLLILYVINKQSVIQIASASMGYITFMIHDIEQLLFCSLLRTIFFRVRILKAHVSKVLASDIKEPKTKLNNIEMLSNKAQLDINSLHRNYELLHKCSEQLNSIMSLPIMIILLSSGLSSIILLKNLFKILQTTTDLEFQRTVIVYGMTRCLKYTILVIIPCYYSSVTTSQVSQMRTILHDAMTCGTIDKLERRRIKAFFQLTRESEFAYALWGVIRLNMSLPLSYLSLCTTYLVIIIQFSKFID